MKKIILGIAGLIIFSASHAQVYQCNVGGSVVFQSKPCAGSQAERQSIQKEQDRIKNAQQARNNYAAKEASRVKPSIGMTKTQVEQSSWGYPTKVNTTTTQNNVFEQWVYRSSGSSRYLHFTNGRLTSISE